MTTGLVYPLTFVVAGMAVGSFVGTSAMRRARGAAMFEGRSACDSCGRGLSYLETVPVVSFLSLRGKCATCGHRIDPSHFIGEVGGGLVAVAGLAVGEPGKSAILVALGMILIAITVVDLKSLRIPNILTAGVWITCAVRLMLLPKLSIAVGFAAAAATAATLQGVRVYGRAKTGREGLGFGDVKLASGLALWLGVLTPWMVAGAAVLGLVATMFSRRKSQLLPFAPMISVSAFILCTVMELGLWPSIG